VGQRLGTLDLRTGEDRIFIERVRVQGLIIDHDPNLILQAGHIVAVSGRRTALVDVLERKHRGLKEVDDKELLGLPGDLVDVVVTEPAVAGRTLSELGREDSLRGVFLREIVRGGQPVGLLPGTRVERGDALTIAGWAPNVARAAKIVGVADRPSESTDMLVVATAIVAGALLGLPTLSLGRLEVGLSLPVGVLLGGLVCGWLRSVRPAWFGRIPGPTLSVFESIGLTGFVAVVGLNAGPDFIRGLQTNGLSLVLAGVMAITVSLVTGVLVGRWLFAMHPGVVLGVCAGGCTTTSGLAAVLEVAKSPVPSLGYGIAYAVGNVLLAVWGTVIVAWLA
jgi:putative transport protein